MSSFVCARFQRTTGAEAVNLVRWIRQLEMQAGGKFRAARDGFAPAFEQAAFAGFDEDDAGREQQHAELREQQPEDRLAEELERPRLGNFEPELVVEGVRRRGEDVLGMREQADEPAFINRLRHLALHPRPVDFEDEIQERLQCCECQQHGQHFGDDQIESERAEFNQCHADGCCQGDVGADEQVIGAGPEQPVVFQPRQRGGKQTEQQQGDEEQPQQRTDQHRLLERDERGGLRQPFPRQPRAAGLQDENDDGERRDEPLLELFARLLRGEIAAVLVLEQRGAALAAGEFVVFQLLGAFACFEPHLEPAHRRHDGPDGHEARRQRRRECVAHPRERKRHQRRREQRQEIDQAVLLNVTFHEKLDTNFTNLHETNRRSLSHGDSWQFV
jgi:hypothetical protein